MLWYLLYPLRRTTEAPVLVPSHPLRAAFSQYGTWAARHVKTVLPISTAVVFVFLYLFPFLYTTDATNITSGVSNLPHHVWTDAQPLSERAVVEPDVIMRSIWIHGTYMKALERDVLLGALELQDELLGPTTDFNPRKPTNIMPSLPDPTADLDRGERDAFHIVNGLTSQSWFFHSPLQYWSGSASNIAADEDIVSTVNARKAQSTSVNVTLRHSIVFSGKRFEERKLVAADALVITLIHLHDSPVGKQWVRKAEALAARLRDKWTIIPEDGRSTSSQLYEFQFRPMSWPDWVLLSVAYSLTFIYLLLSLSRLRAVKSRLGLMVTIMAQIAASIVSSFTICAIFKIDLSRVPYYAYPLVILAISMENSLRLINAVIVTSSSISISDRIGEAFGATAHVAVANRLQNLLILLGLSRITFPGVAAFCTFAAVAIVFDFFYLATFFLSVLSVDLRQRELRDLEKTSSKRNKSSQATAAKPTLVDTVRQLRLGEIALSTRVAGTIVVLGFVLIAQSHYAPESGRQWLNRILSLSRRNSNSTVSKPSLLIDIHQARSPTSWLRLQDHETAREVINVVKPWAHSYVAMVCDPIIFVLKGSDRVPHSREPYFLPAVYDFIHHEIPRFLVLLMTMIAMLLLFTNYLLQDQFKELGDLDHPDDEPLISIQTLSQGHQLDIVMMAASPGGQLISVGLDRAIQVWDLPSGSRSQITSDLEVPLENPFPVLSMAVDDELKQLALVSWTRVFFWNIEEQQWGPTVQIDLGGHKPEAVFFSVSGPKDTSALVVVRRNGTMSELYPEEEQSRDYVVCKTPLIWAVSFAEAQSLHTNSLRTSMLTVSRKGCIHLVRQHAGGWTSEEIELAAPTSRDIHSLITVPELSMYLVGRSQTVDLVDLESSDIIHTFQTEPMQPRSLRRIASKRTQHSGLVSLTLSYVNSETGDLVIQTYLPDDNSDTVYSYNPTEARNGRRRPWGATREIRRRISKPGVWEALSNGSIVGVRRRPLPPNTQHRPPPVTTSGLRRRGGGTTRPEATSNLENEPWETWAMNHLETKGNFETRPLDPPADGGSEETQFDAGHLMISELGPMTKLGTMSVSVGFGNVIKVISVGHEYYDRARDRLAAGDPSRNLLVARRRRAGAGSRTRGSSR
ncbi:sterol-sensing domain of SREBP cleavage-activation-domain-containing protein [Lasiosphaeria hispida]|uniref:Sterol regulatory element-binding protein cleavage-activating protein n=1 Tax=Lasiosphaeria hispida TaxID=260671 RepID=A0AAJ0MIF0_9PEZI|nr:sterol-sensing domain of SREBP cleavage-activation-domain-containing protein [Lasiosphaeria hispida]